MRLSKLLVLPINKFQSSGVKMLEYTQVIAYIIALGIAAAIPGPGMIALVARSLSTGALTGFTLLFGIILGDLLYLSFAVFGLAL